ncbi:release factor H-coupled RctB family protein [Spizellomyces punctatus DAOM BR117]|uniref:3'-phosphate/5'-hydroxy nucleic acid ligase n=1 Tax=Spizellomyces punctatus (strain DAOM BR117) TaxID=645134 RepID=A0A0L0HGL9_SPIPD|nr:release factor H-coupled RctB family protein [Spizellomyces punctatus DAOM BR117]KND00187.1 release factor H-coupled RctB family protein [Spizellomyces punctatus DAOM BR117]|eukprot:XP_016608226.1 release factor H-coupled RctB family protein [Spizellomyces punctatus DAOM BR117]
MPSLRLTLAKNSNQQQRTVVLVSIPDLTNASCSIVTKEMTQFRQRIIQFAKTKLRLTRACRVFLADGTEVWGHDLDLWRRLENDGVILVSAGEDYIGTQKPQTNTNDIPVTILAHHVEIDPLATSQLKALCNLDGVVRVVGMPDLHPGNRFPIGAVVVSEGCAYPALVGSDVGCGMSLFTTSLGCNLSPEKTAQKIRDIEGPWLDGCTIDWLAEANVSPTAFDDQLGTVGAGNHFAEIQVVEHVEDEGMLRDLGIDVGKALLLVHSGSRALGPSILAKHASAPTVPLNYPSSELTAYLSDHNMAMRWASRNRDLIAQRLLSRLNTNPERKLLDMCHNWMEMVSTDTQTQFIHRKGAAPSDRGLCVIPGSRGSFSYLFLPNPTAQPHTANSLAHGAGRTTTRKKALASLPSKYGKTPQAMEGLRRTHLGSVVVCDEKDLLYEEAPECYKEVDSVVKDLVEANVGRVIATLRPVVTYKVRKM